MLTRSSLGSLRTSPLSSRRKLFLLNSSSVAANGNKHNLPYNAFVQFRFSRSRDIHVLFSFRQLVGTPNGDLKANYFSVCLMVADFKALPNGWRRHVKFRLTVVNQLSEKQFQWRGLFCLFALLFRYL